MSYFTSLFYRNCLHVLNIYSNSSSWAKFINKQESVNILKMYFCKCINIIKKTFDK